MQLRDPLSETLAMWHTVDLQALRDTAKRWMEGQERDRMVQAIQDELQRRLGIQ